MGDYVVTGKPSDLLKSEPGFRRHHVIPREFWPGGARPHQLLIELLAGGSEVKALFNLDLGDDNGIYLPTKRNASAADVGQVIDEGYHKRYSDTVKFYLDNIEDEYPQLKFQSNFSDSEKQMARRALAETLSTAADVLRYKSTIYVDLDAQGVEGSSANRFVYNSKDPYVERLPNFDPSMNDAQRVELIEEHNRAVLGNPLTDIDNKRLNVLKALGGDSLEWAGSTKNQRAFISAVVDNLEGKIDLLHPAPGKTAASLYEDIRKVYKANAKQIVAGGGDVAEAALDYANAGRRSSFISADIAKFTAVTALGALASTTVDALDIAEYAGLGVAAARGDLGFSFGGNADGLALFGDAASRISLGHGLSSYTQLTALELDVRFTIPNGSGVIVPPSQYQPLEQFYRERLVLPPNVDIAIVADGNPLNGVAAIFYRTDVPNALQTATQGGSNRVNLLVDLPLGPNSLGEGPAKQTLTLVVSNGATTITSTADNTSQTYAGDLSADIATVTNKSTDPAAVEARNAAQARLDSAPAGLRRQLDEDGAVLSSEELEIASQIVLDINGPKHSSPLEGFLSFVLGDAPVSDFGAVFGSTLARAFDFDDPWTALGTGTLLGTFGLNVAQEVDLARNLDLGRSPQGVARKGFEDFDNDLRQAGISAVSSYLFAELVNEVGIEGVEGGLSSSVGGAAIAQIADNLQHLGELIKFQDTAGNWYGINSANQPVALSDPTAIRTTWNYRVTSAALNAAGAFVGSYLASELIEFDTVGGQIGASLGAAVGSIYVAGIFTAAASATSAAAITAGTATSFQTFAFNLGSFAGPVGAAVGAFVGYILGGLIGSVLGGKPKAQAELAWNSSNQEFVTARVWGKNGGNLEGARGLAESISQTVNGVLAAAGGKLLDGENVRIGTYGQWGKQFIYWDETPTSASKAVRYSTADDLINHGAFIALSDVGSRLAGGNVYVKRALAVTIAQSGGNAAFSASAGAAGSFDTGTLLGNFYVAVDYAKYLSDAETINAAIAAASESNDSAAWAITLARAFELGLDKRSSVDWVGGWNILLDEAADGVVDGRTISPANFTAEINPDTGERLFVFWDNNDDFVGYRGDTVVASTLDEIRGTSGANSIVVDDDTISNASGLTITHAGTASGAQTSWKIAIAARIYAGAGDDIVKGGDLGNDLFGEDGADVLVGGALDDWIFGGVGDDRLFAGRFADSGVEIEFNFADSNTGALVAAAASNGGNGNYLSGDDGDDRIYGGKGSDWLAGGVGVDRLYGGDGGDILSGGLGAGDLEHGGAGSDQYVFARGDGADEIFDSSDPSGIVSTSGDSIATRMAGITAQTIKRNWAGDGQYTQDGSIKGGEDAIAFRAGISIADLTLTRAGTGAGQDLVILVAGADGTANGDSITVRNWFESTNRIEWLRFADGEELRIGDVTSFLRGTDGDDVIIGTNGRDFAYGEGGNDVMHLLGEDDFGFGGAGDDFVAGDGDNDWVSGGSGNDSVLGGQGEDLVFGDAGNDDLYGGTGNDILSGGKGNDSIAGGAGNDVFKYSRDDGRDTLLDAFVDNWEIVSVGSTYLNGYQFNPDATITKGSDVVFDGLTYHGRFDWDAATLTLRRFMGPINGTIAANSGLDTLEFGAGVNIQDLMLRQYGLDLQIAITTGDGDSRSFDDVADRITITNWFGSASASIEQFAFIATGVHDVTSWSFAHEGTDAADTLTGGFGADWITGNGGDDNVSSGAGDDTLSGGQGSDWLKGGAGTDVLYGGASNDVLDGGAGEDELFGGLGAEDLASYASSSAAVKIYLNQSFANTGDGFGDSFEGIEGLEGSNFSDVLAGGGGADELRGRTGDDSLYGGAGDDVYEFNSGDGNDVILDVSLDVEEVLRSDGTFNTDRFTATWTDLGFIDNGLGLWHGYALSVARNGTNEIIYQSRSGIDFLYPYYSSTYPSPVVAPTMADAPAGGAWPFSNGQWKNGASRSGNGVQTVRTLSSAGAGEDILSLGDGVSLSDVSVARSGGSSQDLVITLSGGGSVTILNQAVEESAIETMQLSDGLSAQLKNLKIGAEVGSDANDLYIGAAGADSFSGGLGDDVLSGGLGADTLDGGAGDDILEGGASADILNGGADSVTSGSLAPSDIAKNYGDTIRYNSSAAGVNIDLTTKSASGGDASGDVIVADGSGVSMIENVIGSNVGDDVLRGDSRANRLAGLGGIDTLYGEAGEDVLSGGAGDDHLYGGDGIDNLSGDDGADLVEGGAGKDILAGGEGNDTLWGGGDDDILTGNSGIDELHGGDGADELFAGDGADSIFGDDGDDRLNGGAGADVLQGSGGSDTYVFDAYSGNDVILDSANEAADQNVIEIAASQKQIWFTQSGNDLVIRVLGGDAIISVHDYFAGSEPPPIRQITASDGTIFLKYAGALIAAMTAAGSVPSVMPAAISATLDSYWHADGTAAPIVSDQNRTMNEDEELLGSVGAIDHDENINSYSVAQGPANGALVLNPTTGAWSYNPNPDFNGADSFILQVKDSDDHAVSQTVNVSIAPVNDAPRDIDPVGVLSVAENSPAQTIITAFEATDIDNAPQDLTFSLVDDAGGRFKISPSGVLEVLAYAGLDHEAAASHAIRVRVADSGGLSFEKDFVVAISNVNEAPILPEITLRSDGIFSETAPGAAILAGAIVADLSAIDPENDAITYAIAGDAQNWLTISGAQVLFKAGLNVSFEDLANAGWALSDSDNDGLREASYAFSVDAGDGALTSAVSNSVLRIEDVNEAPAGLDLTGAVSSTAERDRPDPFAPAPAALKLGTLVASDPDLASSGDLAQLVFSVADSRFEILNGSELWLNAGAMTSIDFETSQTLDVEVVVKDRNGGAGALSQTRTFSFAVQDLVDVLAGDAGDDALTGHQGQDLLKGFGGTDTLDGGAGNDSLYGGLGDDILIGSAGDDALYGEEGADQLLGGDGADLLSGGDGADILDGGLGADALDGGAGDDVLTGGAGADTIQGGGDADTLDYFGSAAGVSINLATGLGIGGDAEGDTIAGIEKVIGSQFADTLVGTAAIETLDGGAGTDSINGGGGADLLIGGDGDDVLTGGADADMLQGGAGADTLIGGAGDDVLEGGDGNDTLIAESGNDLLIGGAGVDFMQGGEGDDTYIVDLFSSADVIDNFDFQGVDILSVRGIGGAQIDASYIWLERADANGAPNATGNSLLLSVIGTTTSVLLQDWYTDTSTGSAKLDYTFSGAQYAEQVGLEQLVALMATRTKPISQAAFDTLHADSSFDNPWKNHWGINHAPVLTTVAQVDSSEDATATFEVQVSDDFLALGMQILVEAQGASGAAIVQGYTVTPHASGGGRFVVTITPNANVSGQTTLNVYAVDSGGLTSTPQTVAFNVAAIVDAPSLGVAASNIAGSLDGGAAGVPVSQNLSLPISAALNDLDGSETLQITVTGLPSALLLNKGTLQVDGSWLLSTADLTGLAITGAANSAQDFTLTVIATATESSNGSTASSAVSTIAVTINARPSNISVGSALSIAENSANGVSIASLLSADPDGLGDAQTYALVNNAGGRFSINSATGQITVADGALLDFEANASHTIRARATDSASLYFEKDFTVQLTDVNEAPTNLTFANNIGAIAENTSTATRIKVADIGYTDDALGSENFTLTGVDATDFEIIGSSLYLKAGVTLNYEMKASYAVNVNIDDPALNGTTPELTQAFTLGASDVNEAPTSLTLTNITSAIAENTSTTVRTKVADLSYLDDALGQENYGLSGTDAASFEISGTALYLRAGTTLNYEPKSIYSVNVTVDDPAINGSTPELTQSFTLNLVDVNEAVSLTNASATVAETLSVGSAIGTLGVSDLDVLNPAFRNYRYQIIGGDTSYFNINATSGVLSLASALNYDVAGGAVKTAQVRVWDGGAVGAGNSAAATFTLNVTDVNETPTMTTATYSVAENVPVMSGSAYTSSWTLPGTDPDLVGTSNGTLTYSFMGGDTGAFGIQGNKLVFGIVANYEAKTSYYVDMRATDGGGLSSAVVRIYVNIAPVNETPIITSAQAVRYTSGYITYRYNIVTTDPEGDNLASATVTRLKSGNNWIVGTSGGAMTISGHNASSSNIPATYTVVEIVISDAGGANSTWQLLQNSTFSRVAPIVFDLDGNGLDLVSYEDSSIHFDVDGDGVLKRSGWVSPNDGMLVIDRNQNGLIETGDEMSFSQDVNAAVSDLEGLRAYDANQDGFFSAADDQFSAFQIWKDANQDGVSQASELTSLADNDIAAINLTLNLTGVTSENDSDNVLYGTTQFIRGDGSAGIVGDVMLAYEKSVEVSATQVENIELLAPVVLDLNNDGAALTGRAASSVCFDANNDGIGDRIGWVSAFDGILALDRNGDGQITNGSEISFLQDSPGAVSDLEGLRAFDANANGFFDLGDARFAEFRVWRDSNQDGISQAAELLALSDAGVLAINLTLRLTGQKIEGATDNVVYSETNFVRTDGTLGSAADVFLAYDSGGVSVTPSGDSAVQPTDNGKRPIVLDGDRVAPSLGSSGQSSGSGTRSNTKDPFVEDGTLAAAQAVEGAPQDSGASNKAARVEDIDPPHTPDSGIEQTLSDLARRIQDNSLITHDSLGRDDFWRKNLAKRRDTSDPYDTSLGGDQGTVSALSRGLGMEAKVLRMVDSMATFDALTAADLDFKDRNKLDPKVRELLTSLPDAKVG